MKIIIIIQKQRAQITCKNNLFKPCNVGQNNRVQSKQQFSFVFTFLSRNKQFKQLFSLYPK